MDDIVTNNIFSDICFRITGQKKFSVDFVDNEYEDDCLPKSYNKGRLAIFLYGGKQAFISFSEKEIEGRNSAVQSVSTAFNIYYQSTVPNKELYYYFLGNGPKFETEYLKAIYRQMKTIGFRFLNPEKLVSPVVSFVSIERAVARRYSLGQKVSIAKQCKQNAQKSSWKASFPE